MGSQLVPYEASEDRTLPSTYQGKLEPNYYCRSWNEKRQKYCRARAGRGTSHPRVGRCDLHGGSSQVKHGLYSGLYQNATRIQDLYDRFAQLPEEEALNTFPELAKLRALLVDFIDRYEENTDALLAWHASWTISQRPAAPDLLLALEDVCDELEALIGPAEDPEPREEPEPQAHGGWLRRTRVDTEDEPEEYGRMRRSIKKSRALVAAMRNAEAIKPRKILDISSAKVILDSISQTADRIIKQRDADRKHAEATHISKSDFHDVVKKLAAVVETHNEIEDPTERLQAIGRDWLQVRLRS